MGVISGKWCEVSGIILHLCVCVCVAMELHACPAC